MHVSHSQTSDLHEHVRRERWQSMVVGFTDRTLTFEEMNILGSCMYSSLPMKSFHLMYG
jgi:hypothetical protein